MDRQGRLRRMNVKALALLSALAATVAATAQGVAVGGVVVEAKGGQTIPGAHAVLQSLPDSSVVAFAISGRDGRFAIAKGATGPCQLRISCMGYATKYVSLEALPALGLRVEMETKAFNLSEIAVKQRALGAVVRGDTIRYNIEKYKDGTEQVLGDVLDKLPGIEVNEQGMVTAGGKTVDKLLLNGQDFAGERHDMLTKNLPSDMVENVELLKNYNEYSVLDGFKSKGTALNIGVDSTYTRRPTGNAELWGGHRDKYRARANLFFIGDEAMWSVNGKAYNTGEEAMSLVDYLTLSGGIKSFAQNIAGRTSVVDRPTYGYNAYLSPDESTRRRDDQLISTNVAWNPSEKLRVNAYFVFNREATRSGAETWRTLHNDATRTATHLTESDKTTQSISNLNLDIKYETPFRGVLAYRGYAIVTPDDDQYETNYQGDQKWSSDDHTFHTEHDLSYSQNFSNRRLLTLRAYGVASTSKTDMRLTTNSPLLPLESAADSVWQNQRRHIAMGGASLSFVQRIRRRLRFKAALSLDADKTTYEAEADATQLRTRKVTGRATTTTLGMFLQKQKGLFQFDVGGQLVYIDADATRMRWKAMPQASVELEFSNLNSLSIEYETSLSRDGGIPFAETSRLGGYRTLYDYGRLDEMLHFFQRLTLFYLLYDTYTDLSVTLRGGLSMEDASVVDNNISERGGVRVARSMAPRDYRRVYSAVDIKKGFRIPLETRLKCDYTRRMSNEAYNGENSDNTSNTVTSSLSAKTRFRHLLNVEAGGTFNYSKTRLSLFANDTEWKSYSIRVQPMIVRKKKGLSVEIPLSYVVDEAADDRLSYWDLGLNASKTIGKHLSVYAEARDLLHSDSRDRITEDVSADRTDISREARLPGYVIVGLKVIF